MHYEDETTPTVDGDRHHLMLSGAWNIGDAPNGGYLNGILARAMREVAAHPDPLTMTTHFFRPGKADVEADVEAELVRSGRNTSATQASLVQEGKARVRSSAIFGELTGASVAAGPRLDIPVPDVPGPDDCVRRSGAVQGVELPILDRVDVRLHPEMASQPGTPVLGRAEVVGWVRFVDDGPVDSLALCTFADVFPPPMFNLLGRVGWVPSIELTVHVRRRPVQGWILGRFVVNDLADSRLIEDGVLWDESGQVVAQSRQLGLLLAGD